MNATQSTFAAELTAPASVDVELLAIDLDTCTRCTESRSSLDAALALAEPVLEAAGIDVRVHERLIETEEEAAAHRFAVSPTIRVAGRDIAPDIHESHCDACADLCGCENGTSCREWHYHGEMHKEAPVGLIIEALMHAAFKPDTPADPGTGQHDVYEGVPDNLRRFFEGSAAEAVRASCCEPAVQEVCCEPGEKVSCCGSGEPETCGCQ